MPIMRQICLISVLCMMVLANYDATFGENLCKLTVASYCNTNKVSDWSCKPCQSSPIKLMNVREFYNSTGDNLGFIGKDSNTIYLVFRGTLPWDIKNWIEDLDFIKTAFPVCGNGCQVHRGFYKAYLEIQKDVRAAVTDYVKKFGISKVVVTGHSLGAAIATHAVIDLTLINVPVASLYTFGSPRVGDAKFSQWFESFAKIPSRYRITHGRDPVPHLPPEDWSFLHIPQQIFYKSSVKNGFISCSDSSSKEDPKCSDQYIADVMVTDHLSYYDIDFSGIILTCQT